MSKHKHFHQIKNPQQMLQHGRREGIGPLRRPVPKCHTAEDKETAPSTVSTEDGSRKQPG